MITVTQNMNLFPGFFIQEGFNQGPSRIHQKRSIYNKANPQHFWVTILTGAL